MVCVCDKIRSFSEQAEDDSELVSAGCPSDHSGFHRASTLVSNFGSVPEKE